jgi:hypothetical protein
MRGEDDWALGAVDGAIQRGDVVVERRQRDGRCGDSEAGLLQGR